MTDAEALQRIADLLSNADSDRVGGWEFNSMNWFFEAAKLLAEKGCPVRMERPLFQDTQELHLTPELCDRYMLLPDRFKTR